MSQRHRCPECTHWIPEINKFGGSYCRELNFMLHGYIKSDCVHFEERPPDATGKELIEEFFNDMIFNGECYKMSIKNHEKWERRKEK